MTSHHNSILETRKLSTLAFLAGWHPRTGANSVFTTHQLSPYTGRYIADLVMTRNNAFSFHNMKKLLCSVITNTFTQEAAISFSHNPLYITSRPIRGGGTHVCECVLMGDALSLCSFHIGVQTRFEKNTSMTTFHPFAHLNMSTCNIIDSDIVIMRLFLYIFCDSGHLRLYTRMNEQEHENHELIPYKYSDNVCIIMGCAEHWTNIRNTVHVTNIVIE